MTRNTRRQSGFQYVALRSGCTRAGLFSCTSGRTKLRSHTYTGIRLAPLGLRPVGGIDHGKRRTNTQNSFWSTLPVMTDALGAALRAHVARRRRTCNNEPFALHLSIAESTRMYQSSQMYCFLQTGDSFDLIAWFSGALMRALLDKLDIHVCAPRRCNSYAACKTPNV